MSEKSTKISHYLILLYWFVYLIHLVPSIIFFRQYDTFKNFNEYSKKTVKIDSTKRAGGSGNFDTYFYYNNPKDDILVIGQQMDIYKILNDSYDRNDSIDIWHHDKYQDYLRNADETTVIDKFSKYGIIYALIIYSGSCYIFTFILEYIIEKLKVILKIRRNENKTTHKSYYVIAFIIFICLMYDSLKVFRFI